MILLALMMSSCPENKNKLSNKAMFEGALGVKDPSKINSSKGNRAKRKKHYRKPLPKQAKYDKKNNNFKADLLYLKKEMEERGIPFEKIVSRDADNKKYITFASNTFSKYSSENNYFNIFTLDNRTIKIAHYELSKYFHPFIQKGELDYLLFIDSDREIKITSLENYKLGIRDTSSRFLKNLYYFDNGKKYFDALLKEANTFKEPTKAEEIEFYLKSLYSLFRSLLEEEEMKLETPIGSRIEDLPALIKSINSSNMVAIISSILKDHRDFLEKLRSILKYNKSFIITNNLYILQYVETFLTILSN